MCSDLLCHASTCFPLSFHRAFGDKTAPPVISATDTLVQAEADMDGGESGEEGAEHLAEESQVQNDSGTAAVESSCRDLQGLREGENEEETEGVQGEEEDLRSPQGKLSQSVSVMCIQLFLPFLVTFWLCFTQRL